MKSKAQLIAEAQALAAQAAVVAADAEAGTAPDAAPEVPAEVPAIPEAPAVVLDSVAKMKAARYAAVLALHPEA